MKSWRNRPWPKNWVLKLISFCFALFLWYFVVGEDKADMTISIPVEIVNLPADLTISNQYKKDLELTVNGPRGLVRKLSQQHISRSIDLAKAVPGAKVIKNTPDSIHLPRGVRLLRVRPTDIILQLDKQIEKNISIHAVTTGKVPQGYELASILIEPASLPVAGPQAAIDQIKSISTEPINLDNLTKPTIVPVALQLSAAIRDLVGEPIATAHIDIQEKKEEKTINNIPIQLLITGRRPYTINPDTVSVTAKIPFIMLSKSKDLATFFSARIIAGELAQGKHKLTIEVIPKQGIDLMEVTPKTAIVHIQENNTEMP